MQALDRREPILRQDAPGLAPQFFAAGTPDVEPPRRDAAARAGLHEDFDDEPVAFAGQRALQSRPITLLDDDARDALGDHRLEELERLILVGSGRQQFQPPRAVHRGD